MTERSEITTILQRELVQDPQVAGTVGPGTERSPRSRWRASTT